MCYMFALHLQTVINTIIKTTSVCDDDARRVGSGRGRLGGDTGQQQVRVFRLHTGAGWAW